MTAHTPGPALILELRAGKVYLAGDGGCPLIDRLPNKTRRDHTAEAAVWERNALARIVACVNACEGMDDPAGLREQNNRVIAELAQNRADYDTLRAQRDELAAALELAMPILERARNESRGDPDKHPAERARAALAKLDEALK